MRESWYFLYVQMTTSPRLFYVLNQYLLSSLGCCANRGPVSRYVMYQVVLNEQKAFYILICHFLRDNLFVSQKLRIKVFLYAKINQTRVLSFYFTSTFSLVLLLFLQCTTERNGLSGTRVALRASRKPRNSRGAQSPSKQRGATERRERPAAIFPPRGRAPPTGV